ncbi:subclass B1 metallo-beta-lactamase [Lysobacter auxotrophicus]|uniref:beta-lactamase n=1 Tax=Lysobacter auxotrophicus TaxID=2992573 RepID=A0ABN6UJS8_9GAMM|nr:subclass B1 metallo-beta-lactamase [Lysobacter auxotrophicus]BDU16580.1 subclass B1 metallo-beta-lactamase [Lysobacter auxotrophicus]
MSLFRGAMFALLMAVAPALQATNAAQAAVAIERPADVEIREVGEGVWVHTSYYTYPDGTRYPANGLIVREGDGLVLVDTAWGELATLALLDRIEAKIQLPVRRAVVSHAHGDRLAGADVLEARGIEVYAMPLTQRRAIAEGMPVPDHTLGELDTPGATVRFGPVELFHPGPGHAPDNLMAWVPSQRVLFGGCAVRAAASNSLGSIADANLTEWPKAIRQARARYATAKLVIPGHGDAGGPELLDHTLALLEKMPETGP